MKKYLITGCAGFIGSNFVYYMLKKYDDLMTLKADLESILGLKPIDGNKEDKKNFFDIIRGK